MFKRLCHFCKKEIPESEAIELKSADNRYLCEKCAFTLIEKYRAATTIIETEFNYA